MVAVRMRRLEVFVPRVRKTAMSDEATSIRLRQAFEMAELGFRLMRQSLRRRFPNATESAIREKYAQWITGRPPMSGTDLKVISVRQRRQTSPPPTTRRARRAS